MPCKFLIGITNVRRGRNLGIARFIKTGELNPSDVLIETIEKDQIRKSDLFKNHPEGLSEFASHVCEKFSSLSIQTESLNRIYEDLNNQVFIDHFGSIA